MFFQKNRTISILRKKIEDKADTKLVYIFEYPRTDDTDYFSFQLDTLYKNETIQSWGTHQDRSMALIKTLAEGLERMKMFDLPEQISKDTIGLSLHSNKKEAYQLALAELIEKQTLFEIKRDKTLLYNHLNSDNLLPDYIYREYSIKTYNDYYLVVANIYDNDQRKIVAQGHAAHTSLKSSSLKAKEEAMNHFLWWKLNQNNPDRLVLMKPFYLEDSAHFSMQSKENLQYKAKMDISPYFLDCSQDINPLICVKCINPLWDSSTYFQ